MPELKSSKKRSAPSSSVSGTASKKPKVVHHPAATLPPAKKAKQPIKVKGKKRAQAVTLPLKDDSDTSDEEDEEDEDEEMGGVGFDEDLEDEEEEDLDVDVHVDVGEVEAAEENNGMEVDSKPPKDPKGDYPTLRNYIHLTWPSLSIRRSPQNSTRPPGPTPRS